VPKAKVKWKEAFWGSLFSALGLMLVNRGFTFYLSSGLSRYQLIYGTLGAVVALMTWIYISSLILILGAHLCSAVSKDQKRK
jgi:membrane protein